MAQQLIDLGTIANDGTGDDLRTAGDKINDNFTELYTSGGGEAAGFIEPTTDPAAASGSAYASKGTIVDLTDDARIYGCKCTITTTGSYKLVVAELNTADDTISSILGETSPVALVATVDNHRFALATPATASSGDRIAFIIVRTDGSATSACGVQFAGTAGDDGWGFDYYGGVRYASTSPAVSDSVFFSSTSAVAMSLVYAV